MDDSQLTEDMKEKIRAERAAEIAASSNDDLRWRIVKAIKPPLSDWPWASAAIDELVRRANAQADSEGGDRAGE